MGAKDKKNKKEKKVGKFLSLILRHKPEEIGVELDENGWCDAKDLVEKLNARDREVNMELLNRIVENNDKARYEFNEDRTKIRARQGHSINVDVELMEKIPPEYLYHGTATRFLDSIKEKGIEKGTRQYVHLSENIETAVSVGERHGKPHVIKIDAGKMHKDGHKFYLSNNGVWLVEYVGTEYFVI